MERRVLRTPAAATYTGLSEVSLEKRRSTGEPPKFIKLGRRAVGYDVRDLDAWLEARKRSSTSETPNE